MSVESEVKKIVMEQLNVQEDEVKPAASFTDDLGADSLDIMELVMALEDKFQIEIADEETEKIKTVGDAITYIQNHKK